MGRGSSGLGEPANVSREDVTIMESPKLSEIFTSSTFLTLVLGKIFVCTCTALGLASWEEGDILLWIFYI